MSLTCLPILPAHADELPQETPSAFALQGFGTLGATRSSSHQADFVRDLSQPDGSHGQWSDKVDSLLGVQANYRFDEKLEAVAQAVSRYRYDQTWRPEIGWAFLKWDPHPELSLRVGRNGAEFYMLADSRLVGYSYLPVRPPTDYFGLLPLYYFDGGDATITVPSTEGVTRVKTFYGTSHEKIPVLGDRTLDFSGSQMLGAYLDYQEGAWQWRASYAQIRFGQEFPDDDLRGALRQTGIPSAAVTADALTIAGKRAHYYSVGAIYDRGPLQAQLMLSHTAHESRVLEPLTAGYGLLGYRVASLTPYLGFSRAKSRSRELSAGLPDTFPPFTALNSGVAALIRRSHADQHTLFFGMRWDVNRNVALKVQWDRIRGEPGSVVYQQRETPDWNGRCDVLSMTLDFVF